MIAEVALVLRGRRACTRSCGDRDAPSSGGEPVALWNDDCRGRMASRAPGVLLCGAVPAGDTDAGRSAASAAGVVVGGGAGRACGTVSGGVVGRSASATASSGGGTTTSSSRAAPAGAGSGSAAGRSLGGGAGGGTAWTGASTAGGGTNVWAAPAIATSGDVAALSTNARASFGAAPAASASSAACALAAPMASSTTAAATALAASSTVSNAGPLPAASWAVTTAGLLPAATASSGPAAVLLGMSTMDELATATASDETGGTACVAARPSGGGAGPGEPARMPRLSAGVAAAATVGDGAGEGVRPERASGVRSAGNRAGLDGPALVARSWSANASARTKHGSSATLRRCLSRRSSTTVDEMHAKLVRGRR